MVTILPQIHQLWGKGDFAELADGVHQPRGRDGFAGLADG